MYAVSLVVNFVFHSTRTQLFGSDNGKVLWNAVWLFRYRAWVEAPSCLLSMLLSTRGRVLAMCGPPALAKFCRHSVLLLLTYPLAFLSGRVEEGSAGPDKGWSTRDD